jgi:hypothetical protein
MAPAVADIKTTWQNTGMESPAIEPPEFSIEGTVLTMSDGRKGADVLSIIIRPEDIAAFCGTRQGFESFCIGKTTKANIERLMSSPLRDKVCDLSREGMSP